MHISVYDHQDRYVCSIGSKQLLVFEHTDELNGEDSVHITTTVELRQGYRLVWTDRTGKVHEHVCQDPEATRESGSPLWSDSALCSICEMQYDYIADKRPYGYTFSQALQVALEPTRWTMGVVDQLGNVKKSLTFYHTNARKAINQILDCGGEMEVTYETKGDRIVSRALGIRAHRGVAGGHRRFTYRKDLQSLTRTEHWGAITACYGYGRGVETESGGYGRKLTFGEVNGGIDYVADDEALKTYGRPDGRGGLAHVFGTFEDEDCTDASELLQETKDYLQEHKVPGVSYQADVVDLVAMGREWEGVGVGDDVQIVDSGFAPTLRCSGRVTKLVTDYVGMTMEVTLGNVTDNMADYMQAQADALGRLKDRSAAWDIAAYTPSSYLQQVIDGLNEQFNLEGRSYRHTSFERGDIWASVPMDAEGKPKKPGGQAIQICSQGLRIADGTKSDGSWDWRAFGTGKGFTADCIIAGTMLADRIRAGLLTDEKGLNFWNLTTGDFSLSAATKVGDSTVASTSDVSTAQSNAQKHADTVAATAQSNAETYADGAAGGALTAAQTYTDAQKKAYDESLNQAAIFNKLTNNGQLKGIYMSNGDLYINGTYIKAGTIDASLLKTGIIQDEEGANYWNLKTGEFQLSGNTKVGTSTVASKSDATLAASSAVSNYDDDLDQAEIFRKLVNGNYAQGIVLTNGKLYLNGEYLQANTINGSSIKANTLTAANVDSSSVVTINSSGITRGLDNTVTIGAAHGRLDVKDWGMYYGNSFNNGSGRIYGWVTAGELEGSPYAKYPCVFLSNCDPSTQYGLLININCQDGVILQAGNNLNVRIANNNGCFGGQSWGIAANMQMYGSTQNELYLKSPDGAALSINKSGIHWSANGNSNWKDWSG